MKRRTREENAAYSRALRARRSGEVAPTVAPDVAPTPDHCANCAPLAAEVSRLTACIASLEAQITNGSRAKPVPTSEEADPLRVRVVAGKINTYDKGHNIGRIPL